MITACDIVITAIDFEGTGAVRGYPDEPWQIGLIQIHKGQVETSRIYESLLYVGDRPFNRYAPGRHSVLRDELKQASTLPSLWPEVRPYLSDVPLAAHNVATEQRYLATAFPLHVPAVWLDTLKLTKWAYPTLSSYKLEDVLRVLSLEDRVCTIIPGREPHDALYDAVGCAVLLCHLLQQPGWPNLSVDDLLSLQKPKGRV